MYAYSHKHHSSVLNDITDDCAEFYCLRTATVKQIYKKNAFSWTAEQDTTLGVGILRQGDSHSVSEILVIQADV
jgi:hypothetical protein